MNGPEEIFENEQERVRYAELERSLTSALKRVEAPCEFADRVIARANPGEQPAAGAAKSGRGRLLMMPQPWRVWAAGAVAAVIVMGVLQADRVHQQHERRVEAQREFETAQRITDQALAQVREQVHLAISQSE